MIQGCLDLNADYILKQIKGEPYEFEALVYDKVSSTNTIGKELGRQQENHVKVIISNSQDGGKGRLGRSWSSTANEDIYLSMVFSPSMEITQATMIPILAALAVSKTLTMYSVGRNTVGIKWPNDIIYHNKKIAGILCESKINGQGLEYIVIGIGVNINRKEFDKELGNATSLHLETGNIYKRDKIISEIIKNFFQLFNKFSSQGYELMDIREEYNKSLIHYRKDIKVLSNVERIATSFGINHKAELEVIYDGEDKVTTICSGEVSIRGRGGYI